MRIGPSANAKPPDDSPTIYREQRPSTCRCATERKAFGILAVQSPGQTSPTLAQRDLLETFARQAALVLDRVELRAAAEHSRLLAESERFSRTLLNSISHELRTPLAASTSAAAALAAAEDTTPEQRRSLMDEIQEANARLNRVVGNLLDVARLESGKVRPNLDWHDARDLVQTTLRELRRELASHPVSTGPYRTNRMLARLDFFADATRVGKSPAECGALTRQPGTAVERCGAQGSPIGALVLTVADRGPGIPSESLPRVFDKFFRAPNAPTGGSGLGLTIVKGFVEAHGGAVSAGESSGRRGNVHGSLAATGETAHR